MKKTLLLLALSLGIVSCEEELSRTDVKTTVNSSDLNHISKNISTARIDGAISCYLNDTLEFECADVIERASGGLFMVLANDVGRKKIPYYSTSTNGYSWTTPQQLNIANPNNWQFHHFNLLEVQNKIFIVMHRITSGEGGIPAITWSDDGITWSEPKLMFCCTEEEIVIIAARNMTQTVAGKLIIPVASGQKPTGSSVTTLISGDQGNTWTKGAWIDGSSSTGYAEPTIAQLKDGRLIMLIRTKLGHIYKSYSESEYGSNPNWMNAWSEPVPTSLINPWTAHTLRVTEEGYLIVVFTNSEPDPSNYGFPRDNLTSTISFDDGKTWEQYTPIINNMQIVMEPSITLFGDNKILITYLNDDQKRIDTRVYDRLELLDDKILSEDWNSLSNWNYSNNGITEINKQLHLSDATNSNTLVYSNNSFSNNYTLEVRAKVNNFTSIDQSNTTLGFKAGDGNYRLMMRLEDDGIYVIDHSGAWLKKIYTDYINTKTQWHTWKVLVNNGQAEIYMDGNLAVPAYYLELTNDSAGRVEHWTRSNATVTDCYIDYTYLKDLSNSNLISHGWSSFNSWNLSGSGTKEIVTVGSELHLGNSNNTISSVYKDFTRIIPNNYTLEFRAKINNFNGPNNNIWNTTLGTKVGDGSYRLMMRLEEDGIYVIDSSGTWVKITCPSFVSTKNDWHVWKVVVNSGSAQIYMDEGLVVPSFNLEATNYNSGRVEHWSTSTDNPTDFYIDYTNLSGN